MRRTRALTLMELLVVIAAAALLAGIALPSLQSARRLAKPERCKWNQAKVAEAIFLYAEDFDDAIPYTLNLSRGGADWPLTWDVHIGRIPERLHSYENYGCTHSWATDEYGWENVGINDPTSPVRRIVTGGYVDYPSWGCNFEIPYEGAFICPAFVDQVNPKSRWAGGTSVQFSINGNVSGSFAEYDRRFPQNLWVTRLSDVRPKAVLIGDGNLNPGGETRVSTQFDTFPGSNRAGELFIMDSNYPWDFGPWTHQRHIGKWSLSIPCDFYGHPGGKCNLALADGHVKPVRNLDGNDWIIEPPEEEADEDEGS